MRDCPSSTKENNWLLKEEAVQQDCIAYEYTNEEINATYYIVKILELIITQFLKIKPTT